jgi:hypothetical protein
MGGSRRRTLASRAAIVASASAVVATMVLSGGPASASPQSLPREMVGCWHRHVPALPVGTSGGVWLLKIGQGGQLSAFRPGTTSCGAAPDFTTRISVSGSRLIVGSLTACTAKGVYAWNAAAETLALRAAADKCAARTLLLAGRWKNTPLDAPAPAAVSNTIHVVVPQGQPIEVAFALDSGFGGTPSLANAIQMAVDHHGGVLGFPIRINGVNAPTCNNPNPVSAATTAAYRITSNLQNVAVLGQVCSHGFAQALPIYQKAGMVVVSGSATNTALPAAGPAVFNRTIVDDNQIDAWYPLISQLPSDLAWRLDYTAEFGAPPGDFADLYYDAAGIVLGDIAAAAQLDAKGSLIVDRAALAVAVRHTTGYPGVTCSVTLDSSGNRVDDGQAIATCAG